MQACAKLEFQVLQIDSMSVDLYSGSRENLVWKTTSPKKLYYEVGIHSVGKKFHGRLCSGSVTRASASYASVYSCCSSSLDRV